MEIGSAAFHCRRPTHQSSCSSSRGARNGGGGVILLFNHPPNFVFFTAHRPKLSRSSKRPTFRASSSSFPNRDGWLRQLSQSIRRDRERLLDDLGKETGLDLEEANGKLSGFTGGARDSLSSIQTQFDNFTTRSLPAFIHWHKLNRWKDVKSWDAKRIGVLALYILLLLFSSQRLYAAIRAPVIDRERKQVVEAYMESLIPDPSPTNILLLLLHLVVVVVVLPLILSILHYIEYINLCP